MGIIKPLLGRMEVLLGIVEPVEGLKELYFRRARISAVVELRIPLSDVHLTKSTDVNFLLS